MAGLGSGPDGAVGDRLAALRGDLPTFARSFAMRGQRIAWFLGAGASAMSGIPTAGSLIYAFKHALYCSASGLGIQEVDISDRHVRDRVEAYFDGRNNMPPLGNPGEYAVAFELMYPSEADRATYIEELVASHRPNFGHFVLAALMASDLLRAIFTTNFDDLTEQAAVSLLDSDIVDPRRPLQVADLLAPERATRSLERDTWPLVTKLHGDFRTDRLKNIRSELVAQDAELRRVMLETARRFGMIVVGYSGRDESVMEVFRDAIAAGNAFPGGLYWCYRSADPPRDVLLNCLEAARDAGVETQAIEVDNFIELTAAIERAVTFAPRIREWLSARRLDPELVPAPIPKGPTTAFPILRTNAIPLAGLPEQAIELVEQRPVNLADVHQALRRINARALVGRLATGRLVGFGRTADLTTALGPLGITVLDRTVELDWKSEVVDNSALGLAVDALVLGLGRTTGLRHVLTRRVHQVRVVDASASGLDRLRSAVGGSLTGSLKQVQLDWAEAATLTIERRGDQWWLLVVPDLWVSPIPRVPMEQFDAAARKARRDRQVVAADFVRERVATRWNQKANALLDAWVRALCGGRGDREVRTWNLAPDEGVDPTFSLVGRTAFSRPLAQTAESTR